MKGYVRTWKCWKMNPEKIQAAFSFLVLVPSRLIFPLPPLSLPLWQECQSCTSFMPRTRVRCHRKNQHSLLGRGVKDIHGDMV